MGSTRFFEDHRLGPIHAAVIMDLVGHDVQMPARQVPAACRTLRPPRFSILRRPDWPGGPSGYASQYQTLSTYHAPAMWPPTSIQTT